MANDQTITIREVVKRLRFFNEKAVELAGWSFLSKASSEDAGVTLHMTPEVFTASRIGADDESTAAMVLTLRFFLQPRDGIHIDEVVSLYKALPIPLKDRYWVKENYQVNVSMLNEQSIVAIEHVLAYHQGYDVCKAGK